MCSRVRNAHVNFMDSFPHKVTDRLFGKLIKEVQKRDVLWNSRATNHRRKSDSLDAWNEIARKLNISAYAAKTKWKMLRTIFQRHFKQYKPKTPEDYTGKWKYFKLLWFLSDASSMDNGRRKNGALFKHYFEENHEANLEYESIELDDDSTEETTEVTNDDDNSNSDHEQIIKDSDKAIEGIDSDEYFLRSLAPFLKILNPMRNLIVRGKIEELLMNELKSRSDYSDC